MTFLKNYKQTIILLAAMIIGAIVGVVWGEGAKVLSPFGDIFVNLMLVIIVPLIFLTISTSISKITQPKRLGKILGTIVLVIVITSLVAVLFGIAVTYPFDLVNVGNSEIIQNLEPTKSESSSDVNVLSEVVSLITVTDFSAILTRQNLIAIAIFAIMIGYAIKITGEKAEPALKILESLTEIIMSYLKIVFYYAPFGLGCYFAALVGSYGSAIAVGYLKTFVIYFVASIIFYFAIYTLYAFIAGGRAGVKRFWSSILPATFTALATCSSAASIPVNLTAAKNIGVSDDICEPLIPLGTNFHKDGSIIGSVFKIMFLVCLFGTECSFISVLGIALLATLFVSAIPIGGGVVSEMMIITMLGCPVSALQALTVIATIIDAPATTLNVVGNTASTMLAARIIDGKNWMHKNTNNINKKKTEIHA